MKCLIRRFFIILLALGLCFNPVLSVLAQLPGPGELVLSSALSAPVMLCGIRVHPENLLEIDFLFDLGDHRDMDMEAFRGQAMVMVKDFFAAATLPEEKLWVNLSPREPDKIMEDLVSQTGLGKGLLEQDYLLKQFTASLFHPENSYGQLFWQKGGEAEETDTDTLSRVWIVPKEAAVYEDGDAVYITQSKLDVMMEQDYEETPTDEQRKDEQAVAAFKEFLLPEIVREVNQGEQFARVRQIYHAVILARWYQYVLQETIFNEKYFGQEKTAGIDDVPKQTREEVYQQYLEAFRKGAVDLIKEEPDPETGLYIPKRYFSGGTIMEGGRLVRASARPGFPTIREVKVRATPVQGDAAMVVQNYTVDGQEIHFDQENKRVVLGPKYLQLPTVRGRRPMELMAAGGRYDEALSLLQIERAQEELRTLWLEGQKYKTYQEAFSAANVAKEREWLTRIRENEQYARVLTFLVESQFKDFDEGSAEEDPDIDYNAAVLQSNFEKIEEFSKHLDKQAAASLKERFTVRLQNSFLDIFQKKKELHDQKLTLEDIELYFAALHLSQRIQSLVRIVRSLNKNNQLITKERIAGEYGFPGENFSELSPEMRAARKVELVEEEVRAYQHVLWRVSDFKLEDKAAAELEYAVALAQVDQEIIALFMQESSGVNTYEDFVAQLANFLGIKMRGFVRNRLTELGFTQKEFFKAREDQLGNGKGEKVPLQLNVMVDGRPETWRVFYVKNNKWFALDEFEREVDGPVLQGLLIRFLSNRNGPGYKQYSKKGKGDYQMIKRIKMRHERKYAYVKVFEDRKALVIFAYETTGNKFKVNDSANDAFYDYVDRRIGDPSLKGTDVAFEDLPTVDVMVHDSAMLTQTKKDDFTKGGIDLSYRRWMLTRKGLLMDFNQRFPKEYFDFADGLKPEIVLIQDRPFK